MSEINKHQKPKQNWLSRHVDGQHFIVEPTGDKSKLPKALQSVSFSEVTDMIEKYNRKHMTPEELEDEELIKQVMLEEETEKAEVERKKDLLTKINERIDEQLVRDNLKKMLKEQAAE